MLRSVKAMWLIALPVFAFAAPAGAADRVDPSKLNGKLIFGYQGWFACPGDGSGFGWGHWMAGANLYVDALPDVTEFPASERCPTQMKTTDGRRVDLFSSYNAATIDRHFAWMEQYGLDGIALQRFATELRDPAKVEAHNRQLDCVRQAAEKHGRVLFIMYDLSGLPANQLSAVVQDWERLEHAGITGSQAYLHHRGHPLLALWGLGFAGRDLTPHDAESLIDLLGSVSKSYGGLTIFAGVPSYWRTRDRDAAPNPNWEHVWRRVGVISPWSVGRYRDYGGADTYRREVLEPDLAATRALGVDYMPVVFPGYSFSNTMRARHDPNNLPIINSNPRRCGNFFWRQVANAIDAGASMLYGAMFDELNEGTAMLKMLPSATDAPVQGIPEGDAFVTLDIDGCHLPSDWYLRLGGAATSTLRQGVQPAPKFPLEFPP